MRDDGSELCGKVSDGAPLQELETMKQRLKEMEDETNKLTAPAEGSEEGEGRRCPRCA